MKNLVVLIFGISIAMVSCRDILTGGIGCLNGPSFWCKDENTAKLCSANDYCAKVVWKKDLNAEVEVEVGTSDCDYCYEIIGALKKIWEMGGDSEIEDVVIKVICAGKSKDQCDVDFDAVFYNIKNFINEEDAVSACKLIGMCSSSKVFLTTRDMAKMVKGMECSACCSMAAMAKTIISGIDDEDWAKMFEQICDSLSGNYVDSCTEMVSNYLTTILTLIKNIDSEEICTYIGSCNNDVMDLKSVMETTLNNAVTYVDGKYTPIRGNNYNINTCSMCKMGIAIIETPLRYLNLTITTSDYVIDQLCDMFGYDMCYKLQAIIQMVLEQLNETLDPARMCTYLSMCSSDLDAVEESNHVIPATNIHGATQIVKKIMKHVK